jgi:hypothetical protein
MSFSNPVTGGQGALIRPAIKSPNYLTGVSGWTINRDGSAEFNNGVFRGTVTASTFLGTDFVINTFGAFFYSSAPAAGNLIASIAPGSGTDAFGNHFLGGFTSYDNAAGQYSNLSGDVQSFGPITAGIPDTADAGSLSASGAAMILAAPVSVTDPQLVTMELDSGAANTAPVSGSPRATFFSSSTVPAVVQTMGAFLALDPLQLPNFEPETWQTATPGTGWANTAVGGRTKLQYRKDNQDNITLYGALDLTSVTPNVTAFTLGAAWLISKPTNITVIQLSSAGAHKAVGEFLVNGSGGVAILTASFAALALGDIFVFNAAMPRGNIG